MKHPKFLLALASASLLVLRVGMARADVPVDDFEDVSDWTGLSLDNVNVHSGKGAGRWDNQVTNTSARKTFATAIDASGAPLFRFWAHSKVANGASIMLVLDSENPNSTGWDYYSKLIAVDWSGWKLFVLRQADFSANRNPIGWNKLNYVSFSASGWDLTPLADTVITFDDMSFGVPVIDKVRQQQEWNGSDFRFDYFVTLKDLVNAQRSLTLALETPTPYGFDAQLSKTSVSLPAKGSEEIKVSITVPGSAISTAAQLNLQSASLQVSENGSVLEQRIFDAAVPTPHRDHPRALLDSSDFARIDTWAKNDPWADAARTAIIASADNWPLVLLKSTGLPIGSCPRKAGNGRTITFVPSTA